jgi:amidohydrolase
MASSDEVNLFVRGKGGHAAMPETYDNTVVAAARILVELEKRMGEAKPDDIPSVLAFGKIVAEGAHNVIPSEVRMHGTFRTFDEDWRKKAHQIIEKTAQTVAAQYHTQCELVIDQGYPVLINDLAATELARDAAIEFLGAENVVELNRRMTVEDFARYGQLVPACFYRLGTGNAARGITANLHTPSFNVDESSLRIGTGMMLWVALKTLQLAE